MSEPEGLDSVPPYGAKGATRARAFIDRSMVNRAGCVIESPDKRNAEEYL
jgi:hypothetical protein